VGKATGGTFPKCKSQTWLPPLPMPLIFRNDPPWACTLHKRFTTPPTLYRLIIGHNEPAPPAHHPLDACYYSVVDG